MAGQKQGPAKFDGIYMLERRGPPINIRTCIKRSTSMIVSNNLLLFSLVTIDAKHFWNVAEKSAFEKYFLLWRS